MYDCDPHEGATHLQAMDEACNDFHPDLSGLDFPYQNVFA
jgi:hypothetical protein